MIRCPPPAFNQATVAAAPGADYMAWLDLLQAQSFESGGLWSGSSDLWLSWEMTTTTDHIQVTNGGSEANYITTWNLVEPGDEVVLMVPNYMQTRGLARAFGATVKEWPLELRGGWRVDAAARA